MTIKEIRVYFEQSKLMRKVFSFLRRIRVVALFHSIGLFFNKRLLEEKTKEFEKYYENHKVDFQNVINILCDEKSVRTYCAVIDFKLGRGNKKLRKNMCFPQYFLKDIYTLTKDAVFVDGGRILETQLRILSIFLKENIKKYMHGNLMREMLRN